MTGSKPSPSWQYVLMSIVAQIAAVTLIMLTEDTSLRPEVVAACAALGFFNMMHFAATSIPAETLKRWFAGNNLLAGFTFLVFLNALGVLWMSQFQLSDNQYIYVFIGAGGPPIWLVDRLKFAKSSTPND